MALGLQAPMAELTVTNSRLANQAGWPRGYARACPGQASTSPPCIRHEG